MKKFTMLSIGLFTVATIVGVIDYASAAKSGLLEKLYKEEVKVEKKALDLSEKEDSTAENYSGGNIDKNEDKKQEDKSIADNKLKELKKPVPPPPPPTNSDDRVLSVNSFSRGRIDKVRYTKPIEIDSIKEVKPAVVLYSVSVAVDSLLNNQ